MLYDKARERREYRKIETASSARCKLAIAGIGHPSSGIAAKINRIHSGYRTKLAVIWPETEIDGLAIYRDHGQGTQD